MLTGEAVVVVQLGRMATEPQEEPRPQGLRVPEAAGPTGEQLAVPQRQARAAMVAITGLALAAVQADHLHQQRAAQERAEEEVVAAVLLRPLAAMAGRIARSRYGHRQATAKQPGLDQGQAAAERVPIQAILACLDRRLAREPMAAAAEVQAYLTEP